MAPNTKNFKSSRKWTVVGNSDSSNEFISPSSKNDPKEQDEKKRYSAAWLKFLERFPSLKRRFRKRRDHQRCESDSGVDSIRGSSEVRRNSDFLDSRRDRGSSQYKVISRTARDRYYTVSVDNSADVFNEYISRLSCYDAMPQSTEIVAIDSEMPVDSIFRIMRLQQRVAAVVIWDSKNNALKGVCDIANIVDKLLEGMDSENRELVDRVKMPISEFYSSGFRGVHVGLKLNTAASFFCTQNLDKPKRSSFLPLIDDVTCDVVHVISAVDVLHFLSRQLSKFGLISIFDQILISDLHIDFFDQKNFLDPTLSILEALKQLTKSDYEVLPVCKTEPLESDLKFETVLSVVDLVDFTMRQPGGWSEKTLTTTCVKDVILKMPKKTIPTYKLHTPLSSVLKNFAASQVTAINSISQLALIKSDSNDFIGFLRTETVLETVISSGDKTKEPVSMFRTDSGVGEDLVFEVL